jgi:hypothetical protein
MAVAGGTEGIHEFHQASDVGVRVGERVLDRQPERGNFDCPGRSAQLARLPAVPRPNPLDRLAELHNPVAARLARAPVHVQATPLRYAHLSGLLDHGEPSGKQGQSVEKVLQQEM